MTAHFKSPLTIYLLWHPKFTDGEKLADRLFNTLSRNVADPFARTIGIPVYYRSEPAGPGGEAPAAIPLEESDYNAIVVFVDTNMLLSNDWTEYVKGLLAQMEADPDKTRVFPLANDFTSFQSKQLGAINYIRMFEADTRDDFGSDEQQFGGIDDAAIKALESKLLASEASLKAREANLLARETKLAERERACQAQQASSGVSVGVGQPAVQGTGININITIHQPGSTGTADRPAVFSHAAVGATANAAAEPSAVADPSDMKVELAAAKLATEQQRSAEEILLRRGNLMISKLIHELCRLIISPPEVTDAETTVSGKPVKLFLSHAKADGAEIAKQIKSYIEADSSMKTFFDANDIAPGYRFSSELKGAIETSALICIQTDYYATREWCLFEVITAKRFDRPVVVLDAVNQREPRRFPYIGNVPSLRWNPNSKSRLREAVDLALLEVLDNAYRGMLQKALLKLFALPPGTESLGHAPELFTIVRFRDQATKNDSGAGSPERIKYILYPDPPLGDEEIKVLQELAPDARFITPTMLPAIEHQFHSK